MFIHVCIISGHLKTLAFGFIGLISSRLSAGCRKSSKTCCFGEAIVIENKKSLQFCYYQCHWFVGGDVGMGDSGWGGGHKVD
jgi:hypothetical protein